MRKFVTRLVLLGSLLVGRAWGRRRLPNEAGHNATDFGRRLAGNNVKVPVASSPDDHLVTDLPLLDKSKFPTDHWAGLLPASAGGDKYFFYWLFAPPPTDKPDGDIPLIIWLNGGPACSSMDGLWIENGPFRLVNDAGDWRIDIDDFSWHNTPAYVVYIDQPVGTGISFTTSARYPTNDREVNIDFYYFLKEFFKLHSDKFMNDAKTTMTRKLFFSGESHAGHYIPSMMNYIRKQNLKSPKMTIPLAGAAIGNGWIDPVHQYSAHEAAYGFSLIGRSQKRAFEEKEKDCQSALAKGNYVYSPCFHLLDDIVDQSQGIGAQYTVSQYDYRFWEKKSKPRDFPPGHKDVEAYLGGKGKISSNFLDVLAALHSTPSYDAGQHYRECTDPPYNALKHQDGLGVTQDVVELLNNGVRLLFFNGVNDLICNHVGNEIAVENFQWDHQVEYQKTKRYGWQAPSKGQLGGYMKEFGNLMYLKVLDAGHMVPMDVPDVSLDMVRSFVFGESFNDYEQNLKRAEKSDNPNCPVCPALSNNKDDDCPTATFCADCIAEFNGGDYHGIEPTTTGKGLVDPTSDIMKALAIAVLFSAVVGALAIPIAICWCFGCFRKKRLANTPPRYDLELPNGSYSDRPEEYGEIS